MKYFWLFCFMITSLLPHPCHAWRKREVKLEPLGVYYRKHEKLIEKKWGWKCVAISTSNPGGVLKRVGYRFQVKGPLTEEEIRRQIVWVVKEMVEGLNVMPELLATMENPPATEKMTDLSLFFIDETRTPILDPSISVASYTNGHLIYRKQFLEYKKEFKTDFFRTAHEKSETFDEALQVLDLTREELKDWDGSVKNSKSLE